MFKPRNNLCQIYNQILYIKKIYCLNLDYNILFNNLKYFFKFKNKYSNQLVH